MKVRYEGAFERVDLSTLDITAERGEVVDVPDGTVLGDDWIVVGEPADMTVAEMRAALHDAGIDVPKGAKRADLLALLASSEEDDQ